MPLALLAVLGFSAVASAPATPGPSEPDFAADPAPAAPVAPVSPSRDEATSSAPPTAPYDAWNGVEFGLPQTTTLDRAPSPVDAPLEHPRRSYEFGPELGVGIPHCTRADGNGCATLSFGTEFGLTLLARPTPYFAFGAEGRLYAFQFGAGVSDGNPRAGALFVGLVGRTYFLETGLLDPYFELAVGGGSLTLSSFDAAGAVREKVDVAVAGRLTAGLDLALNSWLRLGSYLSLIRYIPASVMHCSSFGCSALRPSDSAIAVGATSLGLRLTLATGEVL